MTVSKTARRPLVGKDALDRRLVILGRDGGTRRLRAAGSGGVCTTSMLTFGFGRTAAAAGAFTTGFSG